MSAPVGVLAVMSAAFSYIRAETEDEGALAGSVLRARAAVAELIEAAGLILEYCDGEHGEPGVIGCQAEDEFRAALANASDAPVGGPGGGVCPLNCKDGCLAKAHGCPSECVKPATAGGVDDAIHTALEYLQSGHVLNNKHRMGVLGAGDISSAITALTAALKNGGG